MRDSEKTYDEDTSFELATRLGYCVELVSLLRRKTQFVSQRYVLGDHVWSMFNHFFVQDFKVGKLSLLIVRDCFFH